ncbi:MAG TPA: phage holin family protein [Propionicimonas sp.]|jgi:putative membrane protein|nr:phage holin family protein [Propionicimonas sp.]
MLVRFLASAAALAVATWLIPGIWIDRADTQTEVITLLLVAAIFGVVNSAIKPLFKFVTAPLIFLSLGLLLLVINAVLLLLLAWLAHEFGLGWHVDGFWSAFWGGLIVSVVSFVLNAFFGRKGEVHR